MSRQRAHRGIFGRHNLKAKRSKFDQSLQNNRRGENMSGEDTKSRYGGCVLRLPAALTLFDGRGLSDR